MNDKDRADRIAARCESLRIKIAEQDARIKLLEEALGELMRVDKLGRHPECHAESWREWKRAAWERARAALEDK